MQRLGHFRFSKRNVNERIARQKRLSLAYMHEVLILSVNELVLDLQRNMLEHPHSSFDISLLSP